MRKFFHQVLHFAHQYKGKNIAQQVATHIQPGSRVLDFGCGNGLLGEALTKIKQISIEGVDTTNYHTSSIPITTYEGSKIPFTSNTFDVVLSCFVLHHCKDPNSALRECIRVSKKTILVIEDIINKKRPIQSFITKLFCFIGNKMQSSKIECPGNFRSRKEWLQTFQLLGLTVVSEKKIVSFPGYPALHLLFELEKTSLSHNYHPIDEFE